jgi:acyl-CoA synthetase (AMP-forming)/AMP-acid ligase II
MLDELAFALRRQPHRPALIGSARNGLTAVRLSCGDLADLTDGYVAALHGRGLADGDTIGFAVRPGGHALALLLAAHRLGLRIAMLDPTVGPDVLLARLRLAEPSLVLADAAAQAVAGWAGPLARKAGLALPDLRSFGPVVTIGTRSPGCAPALHPLFASCAAAGGTAGGAAVVVFTSGTTGMPRAVVHTRASLDAGMRTVAELVRPQPGQPVLGGTFFVLVPALARGAMVALPARSPRTLARQLRLLRPQETYLTPPAVRDALAAGARFTGRVWSGSAPVSAGLLRKVRSAGATQAWGVYALTEMFPVAVVEARDKESFSGEGDLVGDLVPGVRCRVDPDGQLLLAGPGACAGYLGEPAAQWVATGDIARVQPSGAGTRIVLAGRSKDMILRGAENIYPGLYEPSLHVHGVAVAILVGLPTRDGDERLAAVIQPAPGADPAQISAALAAPLARMGSARPDTVIFATVPLGGRSRKPDRAATALLAAALEKQARSPLLRVRTGAAERGGSRRRGHRARRDEEA